MSRAEKANVRAHYLALDTRAERHGARVQLAEQMRTASYNVVDDLSDVPDVSQTFAATDPDAVATSDEVTEYLNSRPAAFGVKLALA